ncbi:MAG TPA: SRPBCC domain-containing protein [Steroidobacteraceae bacterium]|nr:SRPBCC domain-containing protein [Steroidobacteraceae bacterium]
MSHATVDDTIIEEISIQAPAERIFLALTNPEQRVQWWGAEGRFKATHMESDLRPGGKWAMSGVGMGGRPFTVLGVYREIVRPRLLEFTWLPSWQEEPLETVVRFDLEERDGVTNVRLTHSGLATERSRAQNRGWPDVLAWLRTHAERQGA